MKKLLLVLAGDVIVSNRAIIIVLYHEVTKVHFMNGN